MALPVVVASPTADCVAARTLTAEGVSYELELLLEPLSYGRMLARRWQQGGFVLVEWDIAPHVGAVETLRRCYSDLCAHMYWFWQTDTRWGMGYSLGCTKFSTAFVEQHPLNEHIHRTPWPELDSVFWRTTGRDHVPCVHWPAVAHARRAA